MRDQSNSVGRVFPAAWTRPEQTRSLKTNVGRTLSTSTDVAQPGAGSRAPQARRNSPSSDFEGFGSFS